MSSTIPTHPQSRRHEIAKLLALGIVRLKKRQHQRSNSANDSSSLDFNLALWIDSTAP